MIKSTVTNEDCMIGMSRFADKYFELAIVDPPYGIGEDGLKNHTRGRGLRNSGGARGVSTKFTPKDWDRARPSAAYFAELRRVSKNQIIFGGNYFADLLPASSCWIVWDKMNGGSDFADAELAWTSFKSAVRLFPFMWNGMIQGDRINKEKRIHPTQKPAALYSWLLGRYAKEGDKILDTHLGSGSSRIAACKHGFDFTGFELDSEYFDAQEKRFKTFTDQERFVF